MKMTKKAFQLLCMGLALLLGNGLYAQSGPGKQGSGERKQMTAEERAQKRTDHQKEELGLNDDQYRKVLELNRKQAEKMDGMRKEANAEQEKRKEKMQKMDAEHQAEMNKILTPEQYEKFKMNKEKRKEKLKDRKGGFGKGHGKGKGAAPRQED